MQKEVPTVYVLDDDEGVCESIRWLIESIGLNVKVFTQVQNFLDEYKDDQPGCLILDIRMPGISGLDLQEKLSEHKIHLPSIFITGHGDIGLAIRAMKSGAVDFFTKPYNDQALLDSINKAIEIDRKRRARRIEYVEISDKIAHLTPREMEVMQLVVQGKQNKVIAEALKISPKTVELHRASIMDKMESSSVAELVTTVLKYENFQEVID